MSDTNKQPDSYFLPYQLEWLRDDSPVKIWEKSRRIGATYVQSYEDVRDCVSGKVDKVWFSSADESAAKEYIQEAATWTKLFDTAARELGEVVIDSKNDIKALVIELSNGARIHALSSNPKAFRSKGGKVILDEFAFHEQAKELWKAAKPVTTWGYDIRILSTHNGKDCQYYQFIDKVKQGKLNWSHHKTDIITAVEQGLFDKIKGRPTSKQERKAWIESLREDCFDDETFLEEYMCKATEGRGRFLSYELLAECETNVTQWPQDPESWNPKGNLYLGFDIARKKDFSVIQILEKIGGVKFTRCRIEMKKTPFHIQRDTLFECLKHPKLRRAAIDATGLGMQLAEEAEYQFGKFKIDKVTFTNAVKEDIAFRLKSDLEGHNIKMPADSEARDDYESVQKVTTPSGSIRLVAKHTNSGHADRFWALALGNHAADDYQGEVFTGSQKVNRTSSLLNNY